MIVSRGTTARTGDALAENFVVLRLKYKPGKFTVIAPSPESLGLSEHYGEFTELALRQFLAKRGQSEGEIDMRIRLANDSPELYAPECVVA